MFAERISLDHTGHYWDGFSRSACQAHEKGSKNLLVFPKDYHYREQFEAALKTIDKLNIPGNS